MAYWKSAEKKEISHSGQEYRYQKQAEMNNKHDHQG